MKKYLFLLLTVSFFACSKKSTDVAPIGEPPITKPVNQATKIVLSKISIISSTEIAVQAQINTPETFIYDADNRLIPDDKTPYTYDAGGKLIMIGKEKTGTVTKYTYDAAGNPVSSVSTDYNTDGNEISSRFYEYTVSNGFIISQAYSTSSPLFPTKKLQNTSKYTYDANGNLITVQIYSATGVYTTVEKYTYGTHFSPYINVNSKLGTVNRNGPNEILKYTSGPANGGTYGGIPDVTDETDYSYTYKNNYPVTASIRTHTYATTSGSSSTTYAYEYYNMN